MPPSIDKPRLVLIVEDEWLLRADLAQALQDAGWQVLQARSGEEAIVHICGRTRIDVLITDIKLSGELTRWDVAETMRDRRGNIPVIYTSGELPDRSRRVPYRIYFGKPYQARHIVETCDDVV